jgi:hypothetical protein
MPVWPDLPMVTQAAIAGFVGLIVLAPKLLGLAGHIRAQRVPWAALPRLAGLGGACHGVAGGAGGGSPCYQRRLRAPITVETSVTPMIARPYQVT